MLTQRLANLRIAAASAVVGLLCCLALPVLATPPLGELEAGGIYYDLSDGYSATSGAYARARYGPVGSNEWRGEVVQLERFDDDGLFAAVGNVHQFNQDWYSDVALGTSSGGFFWPELRIDATLNRRWLADRRLVTGIGVTYFDAKDVHSDTGIRLETLYYTDSKWVLQGGMNYNISEPGSVASVSGYAALAHVSPRQHIVTLRLGGGEQAYQPFANDRFQLDIQFVAVRLTWKQWVGERWGVNLVADSYHSATYDQRGVEVGLFTEF